jgi:acetate kinase
VALLNRDVLVVNAGSTSVKLSVVHPSGTKRRVATLDEAAGVGAVGHRVVHGGERFVEPTRLDDSVVEALRALTEIAPLHNLPALAAIDSARAALPDIPHVAVFDTAFHATIPAVARTYALPQRFRDLGIRRFGFHGISVQSVVERVDVSRLVVCHLGGGSSVTAVLDGRSVDTTMGFTPLEGVPMGSRSGSVDPGALLHLLRLGVGTEELAEALQRESGLVGLAGSADVRELEDSGAPEARFALDHFSYRVAQAVGAMAVSLGGIDALVFTGGIGQGSSLVRDLVCSRLAHLGVGAAGSVRVVALETGEEEVIASAARSLLELPDEG